MNILRYDCTPLEIVQEAIDLNYGPRDEALAKLPRKIHLKLEAEINAALSNVIEAAFTVGWRVARNPFEWLFEDGDSLKGFNDVGELEERFWNEANKLGATTLSYEREYPALDAAFTDLYYRARNIAFDIGVKTAKDASWLIFKEAHTAAE